MLGPVDHVTHGTLHHIELWVPNLDRADATWGWLLGELGYELFQDWPGGRSWRLGPTYIVLEQSPARTASRHDRCRPGLNHLAFHVASRALDWDNWRQFSDDRMRDVYAVLSMHTDTVTLDLSYTRSANTMEGQGPAPDLQHLAQRLVDGVLLRPRPQRHSHVGDERIVQVNDGSAHRHPP